MGRRAVDVLGQRVFFGGDVDARTTQGNGAVLPGIIGGPGAMRSSA
jgi:hypothetical protein